MRLTLQDDYKSGVEKISEGNPGALRVLMQCYQKNFIVGQLVLTKLDEKEIYGWKIWELYKDKCGEDLDKFIVEVDPKLQEQLDNLAKFGIK
jgi:hypothetical protein